VCTLVALIYIFVSRTPTRPNCPDSAFRSARPRAPPSHPPSTIWRMGSPDAKRSSAPATPGSFRREQPPPSPLVRSCDSRCDLISSRLRRLFLPSGPWGRNHSPDPCLPSIPSHPEDWSLCLCLDETLACSRWPSLTSTPIRHDRCSRQGSNASCPPRRGATAAQVDLGTGSPKGYDCGSSILPSRTNHHTPLRALSTANKGRDCGVLEGPPLIGSRSSVRPIANARPTLTRAVHRPQRLNRTVACLSSLATQRLVSVLKA
jgi:hypothetical protein